MRRVAVVGSGVAGLAAAYRLSPHREVTLFEADDRFGGHAHTVDITLDGHTAGVDIAFLSLNRRTYPRLLALLDELGVDTADAPLTFSVQVPDAGLEWTGPSLNALFAQRRNLLRPSFLRMLADVLRFNRLATALAEGPGQALASLREPVGGFLARHRFSRPFVDWYLMPMVGALWNCPPSQVLDFPVATLIRYCHNHGLIDASGRQPWHTVRGGSRRYVERVIERLRQRGARALAASPVLGLRRTAQGVQLRTAQGTDRFDAVVLACHSDQALALLDDPSPAEQRLLSAIRFHANHAVVHTDPSVMPRLRRAWGCWSYEAGPRGGQGGSCVHYWLNALQPLPFTTPLFNSINPLHAPDPARVIARHAFAHPVFDQAAIDAQQEMPRIQGERRTWFCGAWMGYGFHEDGLKAGLSAAESVLERDPVHNAGALMPTT